ncbi:MAG: EamA family transporter [Acidobacteriota bacterium]
MSGNVAKPDSTPTGRRELEASAAARAAAPRVPRGSPVATALAFLVIYLVWGSTYLAIRYAVAEIPPLLTAGVRHLTAGALLYLWARRADARPTPAEWRSAAILAFWFFLLGHGSLHWAEQLVPSGLAALIIATEPVWVVVGLMVISRRSVSARVGAGLVIGLVGVGVLFQAADLRMSPAHLGAGLAVLGGAVAWSVGILYTRTAALARQASLRAATTLACGGGWLLLASLVAGEDSAAILSGVSPLALGSLAYLVVFGSLIAYAAYLWLLERCSPTLVATHTYVNPVVAVVIAWAAGDGSLGPQVLLSSLLVLAAIALVGQDTRQSDRPADAARLTRRGNLADDAA